MIIDFGTFKGKSVEWIYENEYPYFIWLFKNVKTTKKDLKIFLKEKGIKIINLKP